MKLAELQIIVDDWIKQYGVRYFEERTNALVLTEEVGEFCRLIARKYGEQSFKSSMDKDNVNRQIADELGDILFVVTCLANQMGYSLTDIMRSNMEKKTQRDKSRHRNNEKIKPH